jgi:hypothetical protein
LKNNKSEDNDKNSPIDVQKLTRHSISVLEQPVQIGRLAVGASSAEVDVR